MRRNSATELERGSDELPVGDNDETDEAVVFVVVAAVLPLLGAFIGQHEHKPGKAVKREKFLNCFVLKVFARCAVLIG